MSHCVMFKKTADPVADPGGADFVFDFIIFYYDYFFFLFGGRGGIYYFIIYKINLLKSKIVSPF